MRKVKNVVIIPSSSFDQYHYEVNKNISKKELIRKIIDTKTKKFKLFVLLHSKKFELVD